MISKSICRDLRSDQTTTLLRFQEGTRLMPPWDESIMSEVSRNSLGLDMAEKTSSAVTFANGIGRSSSN